MTQPWWPGAGEPPAPDVSANPAPWMPPPAEQPPAGQPQQWQPAVTSAHQPSPWMPPPTTPMPAGQPAAVVSTMGQTAGGAAAPSQPQPQASTVAGLGLVTFLLVVGAIAFAVLIARDWVVEWASTVDPCLAGGGAWECVVNDGTRTQVLYPAVAVLAAFSLARGAGVERTQGRAIGWLYALLGFAALALAWSTGAAA